MAERVTEEKDQGSGGISGKTCCHKMNGTNLVVCIDGTSNQFGEKNTNVIELYNLILKEAPDKQRTWYNSGIGTYARPSWKSPKYYKKVLYHKIDLAIAWDFERTVLGAYRWLSDNYKDGDCIFLFGFSRGAYQVRVLSAMIDKVGLIHQGNEMQIPFAYELYADPSSSTTAAVGSQEGEEITMAQRFKNTFSHQNVKVHFVGAWDTVSSIGVARGAGMLPGTVNGMVHVCYFRHALALDERRVKFLPEYAYGGRAVGDDTQNEDSQIAQSMNPNATVSPPKEISDLQIRRPQPPQTLEVWFAGTHSDIGGGNVQNAGLDRSRPPLRWMVFEAQAVGLGMRPFNRDLSRKELIEVQESLTWPWWILEFLPIKRLTYTRRDGRHHFTCKPHLGSTRKIHPDQKIHSSLLLSQEVHNPKARPPEDDLTFWDKLRDEKEITFRRKWVEFDLYEHAEDFITDPGKTSHTLPSIAASSEGRQALFEKGLEALQRQPPLPMDARCRILSILIEAVRENPRNSHFTRKPLSEIQHLVSDLLNSEYQKIAKEFIALYSDRCIKILQGHTAQVNSVALSRDGKLMASASDDCTIRIWNAGSWTQMHELSGPQSVVSTVAFFPDGRRVVSGLWDNSLWVWDIETGKKVGDSLDGHEDYVTSVAVSPDGKQMASGSRDMTVRIWNVENGGKYDSFRGEKGGIQSVAFSPDGNFLASGSSDTTTWIRDLRAGEPVGIPLQLHEDKVMSVSFSPDGHRVASGSADFSIQIFDRQTGAPMRKPVRGHEDVVRSVVFSPDGKRLASGSLDNTVRVWDVETGKQLGVPLQGHTDGVCSVVFSPCGEWIVSGSTDRTIRIWDAGA